MDWLKKAAASSPQYGRDKFGLPRPPDHPETPRQAATRRAQLRRDAQLVLGEVFATLKQDLDLAEAQAMFSAFATPGRRRKRGQHGERNPDLNRRLLDLFDQTSGDTVHERATKLARHCVAERLGELGQSEESIAKQIRRLAGKRQAQLDQGAGGEVRTGNAISRP